MHAARCSGTFAPFGRCRLGSIERHASSATGQRGWNRHPDGTCTGFGVSPVRICGTVCSFGSRFGTTEISARV